MADNEKHLRQVEQLAMFFKNKGLTPSDAARICGSYACVFLSTTATDEADLEKGLDIMTESMRNEALTAFRNRKKQ